MVPASAIRWQPEPAAADLTTLSDMDLAAYYASLSASYQRALHVALQLLAEERRGHVRTRVAHRRLIDEFRAWRASRDATGAAA